MFYGSNCDRKLKLFGLLTEPLNPRELDLSCIFILSVPPLIKFPFNPWLHDWLIDWSRYLVPNYPTQLGIDLDIQFPTILPSKGLI